MAKLVDGISTIGVIGAGQMGNGIAHVAAAAGYEVRLMDVADAALDRGLATIKKNLMRGVKKGRMTEPEVEEILVRITGTTELAVVADVDLVVEAATENVDLKFKIFEDLTAVAPEHTIFCSNTSSISITAIAAHTDRPDRFMGMHFMNPVPVMKLVELIRGLATDDATYELVNAVAESMGKTTVLGRDMPGFIVNRVLMPYINEAVQALYEGIASVEDIDAAMKLGTNVPMGPLTLADFIGLDTCLAIMEVLHEGLGDSKYRPCPLLRKYVEAGWHGRKSGRGFYEYGLNEVEGTMSDVASLSFETLVYRDLAVAEDEPDAGRIGVIELSRPKALNAINPTMVAELGLLLSALRDRGLRALVLTGAGNRAFAAGADIKAMAELRAVEAERFALHGQAVLGLLERFGAPTIAAVNGFALGGGCELAMCCDLILAGPHASFGQPEVKLGVIPGFGGTQRLVRRVGRQRALELMVTGRTVKAEEAVRLGIALKVSEEAVLDEALALARRIAANGPVAVRLVKRAVHETDRLDLEAGLAAEASLFGLCFSTDDQTEGMAAFVERRPARFTGR